MAVAKVGWLLRSMALMYMSEPRKIYLYSVFEPYISLLAPLLTDRRLDLRRKMRKVDQAVASESHVQIFYAIFPSAPKVDLVGLPA